MDACTLCHLKAKLKFILQTYYTLSVGGFSGTGVDALTTHSGYRFSTYDSDNDGWAGNCAATYTGGWW